MPPRSVTLVILVGWLAVGGLFTWLEVWPWLRPGEPNLFAIELVDEAGRQLDSTGWTVSRHGEEAYVANTDWRYVPEDDSFLSECTLWRKGAEEPTAPDDPDGPRFRDVNVSSSAYRIVRGGAMESLKLRQTVRYALPGSKGEPPLLDLTVEGPTETGRFDATGELSLGTQFGPPRNGPDVRLRPPPTPISPRGLVLNPLHPLRRIPTLSYGQQWTAVVIDPFARAVLGEHGVASDGQLAWTTPASVRPEPESLTWDNKPVSCWVIELGGGPAPRVTVWVRQRDGLVLRQDADLGNDPWSFVRRSVAFRLTPLPRSTGRTS